MQSSAQTPPNQEATAPSGTSRPAASRSSQAPRARRLAPTFVAGCFALWVIVAFADFVATINALAVPQTPAADGIVVVTGGSERIEVALELLEQGAAQRLLISGVNQSTPVTSLIQRTQADPNLFDCCIDLDRAALDTAGNAREAADWLARHEFASLLVVTSAYHMPRTTLEMRRLLPSTNLIAFPIDPARGDHRAASTEHTNWSLGLLAREFVKLQLARVRHLAASFA